MKRSKKYKSITEKLDTSKKYSLSDALTLLPQISITKFAGSINVLMYLNLNEKQRKESIRGSYTLPHSFGKSLKILAVVDKTEKEKASSADIIGSEELFKDIEEGKLDFDLLITTPMMMPKLARLGKTLGSKGLMPNPKNGTITNDLEKTIKKFKKGMKNFKSVEGSPINTVIGKIDMPLQELKENFETFYRSVLNETKKFSASPIKRIIINPTMGPKLEVDINHLD